MNVFIDLHVIVVATERRRLAPFNPMPTGKPTPLANAAMDIPPVMTDNVIRPVPAIIVVLQNRLIFLANCSRISIPSRKKASISVNFCSLYA